MGKVGNFAGKKANLNNLSDQTELCWMEFDEN